MVTRVSKKSQHALQAKENALLPYNKLHRVSQSTFVQLSPLCGNLLLEYKIGYKL